MRDLWNWTRRNYESVLLVAASALLFMSGLLMADRTGLAITLVTHAVLVFVVGVFTPRIQSIRLGTKGVAIELLERMERMEGKVERVEVQVERVEEKVDQLIEGTGGMIGAPPGFVSEGTMSPPAGTEREDDLN
jgi:hypothetical protein